MTLADILKTCNVCIRDGAYSLIWNEDRMLGCWQIHRKKWDKSVLVFEDIDEANAAAEFLRLTDDTESEEGE